MIGSPEVNKVIRKVISPVLRENGFSKVNTRNNWGYSGDSVKVFKIRSVGNYFSDVTGWPPMSVGVEIGIYYKFIPDDYPPKTDNKGNYLPQEYHCHLRSNLEIQHDQSKYAKVLDHDLERQRKDIWWIEPNGGNIEQAVNDIKAAFLKDGAPWLKKYSDCKKAYDFIISEHDCYSKYLNAKYFAKYLGLEDDYKKYSKLLSNEAKRISFPDK